MKRKTTLQGEIKPRDCQGAKGAEKRRELSQRDSRCFFFFLSFFCFFSFLLLLFLEELAGKMWAQNSRMSNHSSHRAQAFKRVRPPPPRCSLSAWVAHDGRTIQPPSLSGCVHVGRWRNQSLKRGVRRGGGQIFKNV